METELRNDILRIILEEIYGYNEKWSDRMITAAKSDLSEKELRQLDNIDRALNRIQARCSRIEG